MSRSERAQEVWVDANVILRVLTGEPEAQARAAQDLLQRADSGEIRLRLCPLVVAEVVWVLGSVYKVPAVSISRVVTEFLSSGGITVDEGMQVIVALRRMVTHNVDFIDAYLATKARMAGSPVATFDQHFDKLEVERLVPGRDSA